MCDDSIASGKARARRLNVSEFMANREVQERVGFQIDAESDHFPNLLRPLCLVTANWSSCPLRDPAGIDASIPFARVPGGIAMMSLRITSRPAPDTTETRRRPQDRDPTLPTKLPTARVLRPMRYHVAQPWCASTDLGIPQRGRAQRQ